MSKPRYNWWPFALNMIRDYPQRLRDYRDLHSQKITAAPDSGGGGGGAARTTEGIALRQLPPQEQREFDAVDTALRITKAMPEGKARYDVVRLTMWKGYYLDGAAMQANVSSHTARRYRWQFILLVGKLYGFLGEEEYREVLRRDGRKAKEAKKLGSQSQKNVI